MATYYIRSENNDGLSTIYFNIRKRVPNVHMRICTHIQIDTKVWEAANKSIAAWNKFSNSSVGKPVVEKLELMRKIVSNLFEEGRITTSNDKWKIDDAIMSIVNAEAIRMEEEAEEKKERERIDAQKCILNFYEMFMKGIEDGTIRHGNNKLYTKTTISNWKSFGKLLYGYAKSSDTFEIINKAYADGFCAYLEKCGLMPTTCNKNIICFRKLCNLAIELGVNKNATSMKVWKEREVNEEDKRAEIYLTEEELDVIYHYPLEGEEEKARDLFLLGYLSCQRFSDYGTLTKENFCKTVSGTRIIKVRQMKTDNLVEIPITDKRVDEICSKYNYDFPKITARKINDYLLLGMKKVAESCPSLMEKYTTAMTLQERRKEEHYALLLKKKVSGKKLNKEENRTLKNMVEYAELHNGQPLYERNKDGQMVKFKYEIITTHTARRSGVTNLYKTGLLDTRDMMSISGHKSEATFEHYIKMKKSEHADRIAEKLNSTPNSLDMILGNMSPDDVRKLLKKVL